MNYYKVVYQKEGKLLKQKVNEQEFKQLQNQYTIIKFDTIKNRALLKHRKKINNKELMVLFNEIEMILRAGLTLNEAIDIVLKELRNKPLKQMFTSMQTALKNGQPLYDKLIVYEKQIDPVVISFFKIFHIKGETHLIIAALCDVLNTKKSNKELILTQMSYPILIFCSFVIAMAIIFNVVIPKFEHIFIQYNLSLPFYTSSLLLVKNFFVSYGWLIGILFMVFYLAFKYCQTKEKSRFFMDKIVLIRIPLMSKIYKYHEMYNLFLALRVLHQSHYEFNVALENAALLLKNKYLLDRIQNIYQYIQNGMPVYEAFSRTKLFDELVLNLINTGQMTSNMNEALEKIEEYYKYKFTNSIKRFSSLIEPLFFVMMMLLILWVMLAIFTPIWNMSEMINL